MLHTPGPWVYGKRTDGTIWQSRGNPATGPHWQDDFHGKEDDARLIAAAPDLLNALKFALGVLTYGVLPGHGCDDAHELSLARVEAARAIAKATGE